MLALSEDARRLRKRACNVSVNYVKLLTDSSIPGLTTQIEQSKKFDDKKMSVAFALRKLNEKKYSYKSLEFISGIPHSTLHNKENTMR